MSDEIYMICDAYESGYGHGIKDDGLDGSKTKFGNPQHQEAYEIGYAAGLRKFKQRNHPEIARDKYNHHVAWNEVSE